MDNWDNIPSKCKICDCWCEGIDNCDASSCYATNIIFVVVFFVWGLLASIRLAQFYYYHPYPMWTLKKLIFICGVTVCVLRTLR